jgi:hypothetical protein
MTLDQFLDRMPSQTYNCFDFTREVWAFLTGVDLTAALKQMQGDFSKRKGTASGRRAHTRLAAPVTPCVVFMQRRRMRPHVGIWIDGRVIHLKSTGVEFQPLDIAKGYFKWVSFYQ